MMTSTYDHIRYLLFFNFFLSLCIFVIKKNITRDQKDREKHLTNITDTTDTCDHIRYLKGIVEWVTLLRFLYHGV